MQIICVSADGDTCLSFRATAAAASPSFPRCRWRLRRAATARHGVVAPDLSCQHLSTRVLGWHGNEFLECLLDLVQQAVRPRFSIWISCRCRDSGGAEEVEKHARESARSCCGQHSIASRQLQVCIRYSGLLKNCIGSDRCTACWSESWGSTWWLLLTKP